MDIVTDDAILSRICREVTIDDAVEAAEVINRMYEVAEDNKYRCAGLAANQVGSNLRIILVKVGGDFVEFINPVITSHSTDIKSEYESCLSRPGKKSIKKRRYKSVKVAYNIGPDCDSIISSFKRGTPDIILEYYGMTARVIQHEIDHLNGKLI